MLTGAKGLNLWSSFRVPPPQRSARLYRALVERGLASSVSGVAAAHRAAVSLHRFRHGDRRHALAAVESALLEELDRVRREGITGAELDPGESAASGRGWCSTTTASPTSPTSSGTSRPSRASICSATLPRASRRSRSRRGRRGGSGHAWRDANRTVGWFEPLPLRTAQGSRLRSQVEDAPAMRLETSELSLAPGLNPTRAVLDNGAVFLGKQTHTTPAVTISLAMRAGSICDPADAAGARPGCSRVSSIAAPRIAVGRRHCRRARQPRHHA